MNEEDNEISDILKSLLTVESFIFENIEVKLTGRKAIRKGRRKDSLLVEITPIDPDAVWCKWVNPDILYKIEN